MTRETPKLNDYKIVAFCINESYSKKMTDENVTGSIVIRWRVNVERVKRAQYLVAVYHGKIVGVFLQPNNWEKVLERTKTGSGRMLPRYQFELATLVSDRDPVVKVIKEHWYTDYPFGKGNPVRYNND
mgnify:CR=1 FL=1